jgi:hypothetical protein
MPVWGAEMRAALGRLQCGLLMSDRIDEVGIAPGRPPQDLAISVWVAEMHAALGRTPRILAPPVQVNADGHAISL